MLTSVTILTTVGDRIFLMSIYTTYSDSSEMQGCYIYRVSFCIVCIEVKSLGKHFFNHVGTDRLSCATDCESSINPY